MKNFWSIATDNETGLPIANCNVYVYIYGGIVLATIYSDDGITLKDNPFETDTYGRFNFYVAAGIYYLKFIKSGYTTWTSDPITIPDAVDETSTDTTKNKYVSNKIIKDLQTGAVLITTAVLNAEKALIKSQDNQIENFPRELKWLLMDKKYDKFAKLFFIGMENLQCQTPMEEFKNKELIEYTKILVKGNQGYHVHGFVQNKNDFKYK